MQLRWTGLLFQLQGWASVLSPCPFNTALVRNQGDRYMGILPDLNTSLWNEASRKQSSPLDPAIPDVSYPWISEFMDQYTHFLRPV